MLKKIRISFLVLLIACSTINLLGQNNTSSPYSMFGAGDIANNSFGRSLGMGGVTAPLLSNIDINPSNPASYIALMPYTFIFDVGVSGTNYILKTPLNSASKSDGNIRYLAVGFSINKWWKAGVGLRPITDIGYNIEQNYTLGYDTTQIMNSYTGEGGVNSFYMDNSFKILKSLSLGIKTAYVFGLVSRTNTVNTYSRYSQNVLTSEDSRAFKSFSLGFGAHYHQLLSDKFYLNVGATYNLKTNLSSDYKKLIKSKTTKTSGAEFTDTLYDGPVSGGSLSLPKGYSIGSSILYDQKLELSFDYHNDKWSESEAFGSLQNFKDEQKFNLGLEFTPEFNSIKYLKAVKYRIGFNKSNSYLVFDNHQLKQIGGSIGFGFPLRSGSHINVAFIYSKRYLPNDDRLAESCYQLHLNFSMMANWFYRAKFE